MHSAMHFPVGFLPLRNKALSGSGDFWHRVCAKQQHRANTFRYQKEIDMLHRNTKGRRASTPSVLSTEKLENRAMFSARGMPEVDSSSAAKLDVGPILHQAR
jgi:hypothetical protein